MKSRLIVLRHSPWGTLHWDVPNKVKSTAISHQFPPSPTDRYAHMWQRETFRLVWLWKSLSSGHFGDQWKRIYTALDIGTVFMTLVCESIFSEVSLCNYWYEHECRSTEIMLIFPLMFKGSFMLVRQSIKGLHEYKDTECLSPFSFIHI